MKTGFEHGHELEENEMSVNSVEEFIDEDQLSDAEHAGKPPVSALS